MRLVASRVEYFISRNDPFLKRTFQNSAKGKIGENNLFL